jgi:hypothetical protein
MASLEPLPLGRTGDECENEKCGDVKMKTEQRSSHFHIITSPHQKT